MSAPRAFIPTPEPYEFELFGSKNCPRCGTDKPSNSDFFGSDSHADDGLTVACRECRNADNRSSHAKHRSPQRRGPAPVAS